MYPQLWRAGVEQRHAQDHGIRGRNRGCHEGRDEVDRMLAIRVHGKCVGETLARGEIEAVQDCSTLTAVLTQHQNPEPRIGRGHRLETIGRAIGTAVDD